MYCSLCSTTYKLVGVSEVCHVLHASVYVVDWYIRDHCTALHHTATPCSVFSSWLVYENHCNALRVCLLYTYNSRKTWPEGVPLVHASLRDTYTQFVTDLVWVFRDNVFWCTWFVTMYLESQSVCLRNPYTWFVNTFSELPPTWLFDSYTCFETICPEVQSMCQWRTIYIVIYIQALLQIRHKLYEPHTMSIMGWLRLVGSLKL